MKMSRKKTLARERRVKFVTGGGPSQQISKPSLTDSLISDQQPLSGVYDDDHLASGEYLLYSKLMN